MMMWSLALALVMGCSPPEGQDIEVGEPDDPGVELDTGDTGEDGPVSETWGLVQVYSTLVKNPNPLSSEEGISTTTSTKLLAWERDGTEVSFTETLCALETTEVFSTVTSYPAAFIENIAPLDRQASLSDTVTGADFEAGPFVDLLAVQLDDPGDPLPTQADAPSVLDHEGDGHPGATVHVSQDLLGEGDVYVIQRTTTSMSGTVLSPDRIEGRLSMVGEQVVLGASTWWLELDTDQRPDPDPEHSFFAMQRLEPDASCEDVGDIR